MTPPRMTQDDVGGFYAGEDGSLWRLVAYAASPTATLEQVHPAPPVSDAILGRTVRRSGVVGAPIFDGFTRLLPDRGDEQVARCAFPGCPNPNEDIRPVGRVRVGPTDVAPEVVFSCPGHMEWLRRNGAYVAFDDPGTTP